MLRRNRFLLLLGVISLALILTVCFSSSYAQQKGEVKAIRQTLISPFLIDPGVGQDFTAAVAFCNLYDPIVFPAPDGSAKPWLAKDWKISEDGLTYTFDLVTGVKFHNGDELTAEDVVFTLNRLITIGEGYGFHFSNNVKEGKVLDTYKFQIVLKNPFAPFLGTLTKLFVLNKNEILEHKTDGPYGEFGDYAKEWLVDHDAGSGPYKLKEFMSQEYFIIEKYDDYWAGWENQDAPQYVKLIGTTDAITVRTLFARGELEISDQYQLPENLEILQQIPGTEVVSFFEGAVSWILMHNQKPPTDDVHFRRAFAYSIDYESLREECYPDNSQPSTLVASTIPGSNPNIKPITRDLIKAEEELKQSPYYGKLDQYPIDLYWNSNNLLKGKMALMIQANAAEAGIRVDIYQAPWLTMIENASKIETTAGGSMTATNPVYLEAGSILEIMYHSRSHGSFEQSAWYDDPELDAMIEDAVRTLDKEERFKKYHAIQGILEDLCPYVPLLEYGIRQAYRGDIVEWPVADMVKRGEYYSPILGQEFYYRDMKVFPEKAIGEYVPFKP